jgi:hypothetical protein
MDHHRHPRPPAVGRIEFAIWLLRAILRADECRYQPDGLVQPRLHQYQGQGGMAIRHELLA